MKDEAGSGAEREVGIGAAAPQAGRRGLVRRTVDYFDPGVDGFIERMARLAIVPIVLVVLLLCGVAVLALRTEVGQFTTVYALVEVGRYEQALPIAERLVREHPRRNWHYYRKQAQILRGLGRTDEALAVYDAAVAAMPDEWWAHSHRCFYYALLAEPTSDSMASCDAQLELNPSRPETAYDRRGFARVRVGDHAGAIADFQEELDILARVDPHDWRIRSRTGWLESLRSGTDPLTPEELAHERGHYQTGRVFQTAE
jgi:tetratricopeptide (TPR) repeat protein